ncbi:ArsR/SmtB family transcription factor [Streptomyces sp. NRRL B-1347]|uniref:ArsR/SmtB family transcription factor n=1 Tax=Streptomyces sp. NRRL B-1347 TaxID=1476877 RepID=UPI00099D89AB|nr:helix-turn-helix domain-containing protein [Streptomyces sp. NRRL B-1347]
MADEERAARDRAADDQARSDQGEDARHRVLDPEQDAAALKALTHPLRIRLLGLLRADGPATASELAVKTGESSASTSYHLRVLAKYGFVAEAEHRDGRERRWRSVHAVTSWNNADMDASPGGRAFRSTMARRQIEHLGRSLARHERDLDDGRIGPEWREHAGITDLMPRLTADSLAELWQAFEGKLAELTARDADDPRAEQVVVFAATLPLAERLPGEQDPLATPGEDDGSARTEGTGAAAGPPGGSADPGPHGPDDPGPHGPDGPGPHGPDGPGEHDGPDTHRNVTWGVS